MNSFAAINTRKGWTGVWLVLVLLSILLFGLVNYLLRAEDGIAHFRSNRMHFQKMEVLNQELETLPFRMYRYIDHDAMRKVFRAFEGHIDSLLKVNILKSRYGSLIHGKLNTLKEDFQKKEKLSLRFEALNANLTNSLHVLFDLRKSMLIEFPLSKQSRESLDQLFFVFLQTLMGVPLDSREKEIKFLQLQQTFGNDRLMVPLQRHMRLFFQYQKEITKVTTAYQQIRMFDEISYLIDIMANQEEIIRKEQKQIGIIFFLLAFGMLFLLALLYKKQQREHKELLAFKLAVENGDNIVVLTDVDRHIEYVNRAFEKHTGYTLKEVYGKNPNILKSEQVPNSVYKDLNETLDRGEKWQGELTNRRKDGVLIYEKVSIVPIFMDKQLIQYLAIKLDVTDYVRQQKILEQSAIVYQNMGDGVLITDAEQTIVSCNGAFSAMFGYGEAELVGKKPTIIVADMQNIRIQAMQKKLAETGEWSGRLESRRKDGTLFPIWLTIAVAKNTKGEIENYIGIHTNLQEIITMEDQIHFLAYHDSLTGLPNRTEFTNRISSMVQKEGAMWEKVAILFIDLDRFKTINDTLGHHIGDRILVELTRRMTEILDRERILFRIGGDEFVVMMGLIQEEAEAAALAESLLEVIRQPMRIEGYQLSTSASIGIAVYPDHGTEEADLMKHADAAMYHAKELGQDTYCFYTRTLSLAVQRRHILEQELQYAVQKHEFYLYYQPQYSLKEKQIIGVEALLRWKNSKLGIVPPEEFISIAEETGLIGEIGDYVFEEACTAYMRWQSQGIQLNYIAINISSIQFREKGFFERFEKIMRRHSMPPSSVELEITERFILDYSSKSIAMLEQFRAIGCRIAIDDFGTGYSSMNYLMNLPLDTIKIDQSFIREVPGKLSDTKVIKAIIALTRSLGYQVIAEGIETRTQEEFLETEQCDLGQGYLFAYPMCEADFISFYQEKS